MKCVIKRSVQSVNFRQMVSSEYEILYRPTVSAVLPVSVTCPDIVRIAFMMPFGASLMDRTFISILCVLTVARSGLSSSSVTCQNLSA